LSGSRFEITSPGISLKGFGTALDRRQAPAGKIRAFGISCPGPSGLGSRQAAVLGSGGHPSASI